MRVSNSIQSRLKMHGCLSHFLSHTQMTQHILHLIRDFGHNTIQMTADTTCPTSIILSVLPITKKFIVKSISSNHSEIGLISLMMIHFFSVHSILLHSMADDLKTAFQHPHGQHYNLNQISLTTLFLKLWMRTTLCTI